MLLQDYSESEGSSPHNLRLLSDALGPTYKIPIQGKDHALQVLYSKANFSYLLHTIIFPAFPKSYRVWVQGFYGFLIMAIMRGGVRKHPILYSTQVSNFIFVSCIYYLLVNSYKSQVDYCILVSFRKTALIYTLCVTQAQTPWIETHFALNIYLVSVCTYLAPVHRHSHTPDLRLRTVDFRLQHAIHILNASMHLGIEMGYLGQFQCIL